MILLLMKIYFYHNNIYTANTNINRVLIVIHGININAGAYYHSIYHFISNIDFNSEALVVAPQFLITTDFDSWALDNSTVLLD